MKSKDLREEFASDYTKLGTLTDIPLHKTEKMQPFLQKYCRQACSPPHVSSLRKLYVPRLFEKFYSALDEVFKSQPVGIAADETTDVRDHSSILNVIASVRGKPYLIGADHMELYIQSGNNSVCHRYGH